VTILRGDLDLPESVLQVEQTVVPVTCGTLYLIRRVRQGVSVFDGFRVEAPIVDTKSPNRLAGRFFGGAKNSSA
jgi:hypothetical protein